MELTLERDKECKHSIRYSEQKSEGNSKNIYLSKPEVEALGNPQTLKVTIEAV